MVVQLTCAGAPHWRLQTLKEGLSCRQLLTQSDLVQRFIVGRSGKSPNCLTGEVTHIAPNIIWRDQRPALRLKHLVSKHATSSFHHGFIDLKRQSRRLVSGRKSRSPRQCDSTLGFPGSINVTYVLVVEPCYAMQCHSYYFE